MDKADKCRFRPKAGNGQVSAVGADYASKSAAVNGIASIRKNAPADPG